MEAAETDRFWHRLQRDGDSRRLFLLSISMAMVFLGSFFLIGSTQLSSFSEFVGSWHKVMGKVQDRVIVSRTFPRQDGSTLEVLSLKLHIAFTHQGKARTMTFLLPAAGDSKAEAQTVADSYSVGSDVPLRIHPEIPEQVLVNVESSLVRTRRMGDLGFLFLGLGLLMGGATFFGLLTPSAPKGRE